MSTRLCFLYWLIWFLCFRFDALTELSAFIRTEFLCVSVLRVASGPRVKLASCKSALNPPVVYSTDRSKAVVPVLVLLFVALWFILRGDLLCVFPCVILFLCFLVLLVLRLPRLGKRELILVLFVRLFDLCLFGFVGFLFLLGSRKGCGLWLWHCLGFSLTFFWYCMQTRFIDLLQIIKKSLIGCEFSWFHQGFRCRLTAWKCQEMKNKFDSMDPPWKIIGLTYKGSFLSRNSVIMIKYMKMTRFYVKTE